MNLFPRIRAAGETKLNQHERKSKVYIININQLERKYLIGAVSRVKLKDSISNLLFGFRIDTVAASLQTIQKI